MADPKPGFFVLRNAVQPALTAGAYTLNVRQDLVGDAGSLTTADPLPDAEVHFEVTSPRFLLPPDQVLSTYPPNMAVGAFGSRLPQVVLKRRTLPWERKVGDEGVPWLALVLVAEGEAKVQNGVEIAKAVTSGVVLAGRNDVQTCAILEVTSAQIASFFPARDEVALLAHVRQVDLSDTELAMGDDDGWMSVVVGNRLPQEGVRYRACLISLEGQLHVLPSSDELDVTDATTTIDLDGLTGVFTGVKEARLETPMDAWSTPARGSSASRAPKAKGSRFRGLHGAPGSQPKKLYRFPVLLQWSFTCAEAGDFQSRMQGLNVGLLGTVTLAAPGAPPRTRPAPQVTDTAHVALAARTRDGEPETVWYRGPLLPFAGTRVAPDGDGVLPLRHVSDQGRMIGPDGREQVGLAVAFEIGRLLALAESSVVAALLRWRKRAFEVERLKYILSRDPRAMGLLSGAELLAARLGASLLNELGANEARRLGPVLPIVDPTNKPIYASPLEAKKELLLAMGIEDLATLDTSAFSGEAWTADEVALGDDLAGLRLAVEARAAELGELAAALEELGGRT